jgi:hypothetical protein
MTSYRLLRDGGLFLRAHPDAAAAVRRWLPLSAIDAEVPPAGAAVVTVEEPRRDAAAPDPDPAPADLRLGMVEGRVRGDTAVLSAPHGLRGRVDLAAGAAQISPGTGDDEGGRAAAGWEVYSACTLACALLLGRMERALVHAAAVADPDGGAWLLVGDAYAGKTTTCVNLVTAGWGYLSDDHVVLGRGGAGGVEVEGWPRAFHLDEGWAEGAPTGKRTTVDPRDRWAERWRPAAPLAGLLFPRVEAGRPTELAHQPAAAALAGLLRQSPWLLADRAAAPGVLALLKEAATHPARGLRLGLDTYGDPPRLAGLVAGVTGVATRPDAR